MLKKILAWLHQPTGGVVEIRGGDNEYPPSWIDDEALSRPAYLYLRKLVVAHQTRQELLKVIKETPVLFHSGLDKSIIDEIKAWAGMDSSALLMEIQEIKQRVKALEVWKRLQASLQTPKVKEESEKFKTFRKELTDLCQRHSVALYNDYEDGGIYVEDLDEGESPIGIHLADETSAK